jgi:hypothetical protein
VDLVTETQQIIGEITPVLAGDAGDQRSFCHALIVSAVLVIL